MKKKLKNALIIDGTGKKGSTGDLIIEDDKITAVGKNLQEACDEVYDLTGKVLCPGFIDTHSHSDLEVLVRPGLLPKIHQGITTEILGQDGISMAPLPTRYIPDWRKNLAGLDGDSDNIDWEYETTGGYLKSIDKVHPAVNMAYLVPHGNVRMEAMGLENRSPSPEEMEKMKEILKRELESGAVGLSTGLIYIPCAYGMKEELIELCKVTAQYKGVFVVHQRSEADTILPSMDEIIDIGRQSGVKIHFSHFKVCGRQNWDKIDSMLKKIDEAEAEGISISFDQYPYAAGSTMLAVILPPWVHDGGTNACIRRLQDEILRERIRKDIQTGIPGWDNFIDFARYDGIYITSVKTEKNQDLVGKNLVQLGAFRQKDPLSAALDLLVEENNAVGMVDYYGLEEHVIRFMKRPEQNVCTDGLLGGKPHPRVYGSFPRVLQKYVREEKVMTLEEAIHKMTQKPADVFSIYKRGVIQEGYYADIVVFDPETIKETGTFIEPDQFPVGIEYVFVNGVDVLEEKIQTKKPGRVLRAKGERRKVK